MLQLKNETPFQAAINVLPDTAGVDTLIVVVKATFTVGQTVTVSDEQVEIREKDEYWGEPAESSLKYASEVHLAKPATDIALVGTAWSPKGKAAQLPVRLSVGPLRKEVMVYGDRQWKLGVVNWAATKPAPFESMPLQYERAYGGVYQSDDGKTVLYEERNPVGVGFVGKESRKKIVGLPMPNLEDPAHPVKHPVTKVSAHPAPAGFGFIAPTWKPRLGHAGTYDEKWEKERCPYLPKDFDPRFFNAAHPDLIAKGYLKGGEPVQVINASRDGPLRFDLPACDLDISARIRGEKQELEPNLETVLIEPDDSRVCLLWRAQTGCDKSVLKVEEVTIRLGSLGTEG